VNYAVPSTSSRKRKFYLRKKRKRRDKERGPGYGRFPEKGGKTRLKKLLGRKHTGQKLGFSQKTSLPQKKKGGCSLVKDLSLKRTSLRRRSKETWDEGGRVIRKIYRKKHLGGRGRQTMQPSNIKRSVGEGR